MADRPLCELHCPPHGEHPVVCGAAGEMNSLAQLQFSLSAYQGTTRGLSPVGRDAPSHRLPAPPGRGPSPGRGPHSRGGVQRCLGRQAGHPANPTPLPLPVMLGLVSLPLKL